MPSRRLKPSRRAEKELPSQQTIHRNAMDSLVESTEKHVRPQQPQWRAARPLGDEEIPILRSSCEGAPEAAGEPSRCDTEPFVSAAGVSSSRCGNYGPARTAHQDNFLLRVVAAASGKLSAEPPQSGYLSPKHRWLGAVKRDGASAGSAEIENLGGADNLHVDLQLAPGREDPRRGGGDNGAGPSGLAAASASSRRGVASHSQRGQFRPLEEFGSYIDSLQSSTTNGGKARVGGLTTADEYAALVRVCQAQDVHALRKRGKRRFDEDYLHGGDPSDPRRRHVLRNGRWELLPQGVDGRPVLVRTEGEEDGTPRQQIWVHEGNVERYLYDIHVNQLQHGGMDRTWNEAQVTLYGCTQSLCRKYVKACSCIDLKSRSGKHLMSVRHTKRKLPHISSPPEGSDFRPGYRPGAGGLSAGALTKALAAAGSHGSGGFWPRPLPPTSPEPSGSKPSAKARRVSLTASERESILEKKMRNPFMTQFELIDWCAEVFGKKPSQPMISKILRAPNRAGQTVTAGRQHEEQSDSGREYPEQDD